MLKIKDLKARVQGKEVLKGVNLSVAEGEIVALMGPNGSGKSSLAATLMGSPSYKVTEGEVVFAGEDLLTKTVDERARKGLALVFQYPVEVPGVTVREVLLASMRADKTRDKVSALDLKKEIEIEAEKLDLDLALLGRGVNDGLSGGEKKKMEILQMKILKPKLIVLDEVDSGLDVDALKVVAKNIAEMVSERRVGVLVITHYQRILQYLVPDRVAVMKAGVITLQGGKELADEIEKHGYK